MGNEGYCEIGDMPVAWCGHCKGLRTPEEEAAYQRKLTEDFMASLKENDGKRV